MPSANALPASTADHHGGDGKPRWVTWLSLLWALLLLVNVALLGVRLAPTSTDGDHHWLSQHLGHFRIQTDLAALLPQAQQADWRQALAEIDAERNRQLLVTLRFPQRPSLQTLTEVQQYFPTALATAALPARMANSESRLADIVQSLFPYRQQLLSTRDAQWLADDNADALVDNALAQWYGVVGVNESDLHNDPLLLYRRVLQDSFNSAASLGDGWQTHADAWLLKAPQTPAQPWLALLPLTLKASAFDTQVQQALKKHLDSARQYAQTQHATLSAVGAVVFAEHGFSQSRQEIATVGLGGLLGIVLLLAMVFRSLRPLLALVVVLGLSLALAVNVTAWWFGQLHIVALLFSAAVVGISVDYGFHFFTDYYQHADGAWRSVRRILSGLTVGMFSSVLAYAFFTTGGLLLLHQVAVLAIVGLPAMFISVVLLLPWLMPKTPRCQTLPPALVKLAAVWLRGRWRTPLSHPWVLLMLTVGSAGLAWLTITPNDDVRDLQALPPALLTQEKALRTALNQPFTAGYVGLMAADSAAGMAALLDAERTLIARDPAAFHLTPHAAPLRQLLPDIASQQRHHAAYQRLYESASAKRFADALPGANFQQLPFQTIPVRELVKQAAWQQQLAPRLQALPATQTEPARWLLLLPLRDAKSSRDWCANVSAAVRCQMLNPTADISTQFQQYRQTLLRLLAGLAVVLLLLAVWRYGARGVAVALLPVLAALWALMISAVLGASVNIFSVLAMLLVLGMGLDYVIFLAETGRTVSRAVTVMVSLLLSCATTLLSFGLLALSATTAVASFGLTTAIGMMLMLVFAPAVMSCNKNEK